MAWVPKGDDLIDVLLSNGLTQGRHLPNNFSANQIEELWDEGHVFVVDALIRIARIFVIFVEIKHQHRAVVSRSGDLLDDLDFTSVGVENTCLHIVFGQLYPPT